MGKQRYFHLVYLYKNKVGLVGTGSCQEYGDNYINLQQSIKWIIDREGYETVIITNIIEMSKEDFEEFTRTEEKV